MAATPPVQGDEGPHELGCLCLYAVCATTEPFHPCSLCSAYGDTAAATGDRSYSNRDVVGSPTAPSALEAGACAGSALPVSAPPLPRPLRSSPARTQFFLHDAVQCRLLRYAEDLLASAFGGVGPVSADTEAASSALIGPHEATNRHDDSRDNDNTVGGGAGSLASGSAVVGMSGPWRTVAVAEALRLAMRASAQHAAAVAQMAKDAAQRSSLPDAKVGI